MEIVQDDEYFHIQREDAPLQWQPGQTLFVGRTINPFMGYYDTHLKALRAPSGHLYHIRWLLDHVSNVLTGREDKHPELETFYSYDPIHTLQMASEALKEYLVLVRELVFEDVRREQFPELPSRQRCIWVIPTKESVEYWYTQLSGRLLRLRLTGKVHRTSQQYLTADTLALDQFRQNAFKYWAGIKGTNSVEDEILFEGFVTVLDEVRPEEIALNPTSTVPRHALTENSGSGLSQNAVVTSSSVITPAIHYQASAWVSVPNPKGWSEQTVFGQLAKDGIGVAGAEMYCVVHYKSQDSRWPKSGYVITGIDGVASVTFSIGGATAGHTVDVDVHLVDSHRSHRVSTSFTPQS